MVSRLRSVEPKKVANQAVKYFDRRLIVQQSVTTGYGFGPSFNQAYMRLDEFGDLLKPVKPGILLKPGDCSVWIAAKARDWDCLKEGNGCGLQKVSC